MISERKTLGIGSISSGTMREEDLIPDFLWELQRVDPERSKAIEDDVDNARVLEALEYEDGLDDDDLREQASYLVEELFDALDEYTPDYCTFGAHEGDGADYGVWVDFDSVQRDVEDGEIGKYDDHDDDSDDGLYLDVNDHGNATLYVSQAGTLTEVWSVV